MRHAGLTQLGLGQRGKSLAFQAQQPLFIDLGCGFYVPSTHHLRKLGGDRVIVLRDHVPFAQIHQQRA